VSRFVRVNAANTPLFNEDVALLAKLQVDGLVLPKASLEALERLGPDGPPVLAIVETASALRAAYEIASSPRVFALLLGAVDLGAALDLQPRPDGFELMYARSKLVVDSAAAGIRSPFDGVHLAIADADAVEAEARLARSMGMGGKACVHPAQVSVVNRVFLPSEEEVEWARRVVSAATDAEREGSGAVALDGAMVDAPVVKRARSILERQQGA
jgi:citrate lyase beta subunit